MKNARIKSRSRIGDGRKDIILSLRLPEAVVKKADLIAAEMLCPRSYALRKLLLRGLERMGRR